MHEGEYSLPAVKWSTKMANKRKAAGQGVGVVVRGLGRGAVAKDLWCGCRVMALLVRQEDGRSVVWLNAWLSEGRRQAAWQFYLRRKSSAKFWSVQAR